LRYEIAVSLIGKIVSVNGPFPAGSHPDIKIFKSNLKYKLNHGECILSDNGYIDVACCSPNHLCGKSVKFASELSGLYIGSSLKSFKSE